MSSYLFIFINSFKSSILLSLYHESAWFAALQFGGYNMPLATFCAITGSSSGIALNFALGRYLGSKRDDWYSMDEAIYLRLKKYIGYSVPLLLLPFPDLPLAGQFFALYTVMLGLLGVRVRTFIVLALAGRVIYYGYYLLGITLF